MYLVRFTAQSFDLNVLAIRDVEIEGVSRCRKPNGAKSSVTFHHAYDSTLIVLYRKGIKSATANLFNLEKAHLRLPSFTLKKKKESRF